jgi:hypothetical protein
MFFGVWLFCGKENIQQNKKKKKATTMFSGYLPDIRRYNFVFLSAPRLLANSDLLLF